MNLSLFSLPHFLKIIHGNHLRKYILPALSAILLFAMLIWPDAVFTGAKNGLLLWFNTVLPTLFPFILICNLCIETDTIRYLLRMTSPLFCRLFHVTPYGSFVVLAGFLCGYPMGSKVAADLYRHGRISKSECTYLVSFCNNTSPMFIISFLVMQNLKNASFTIPVCFLLYLSPILCSFLFRLSYRQENDSRSPAFPLSESNKEHTYDILDNTISNALDSITKIGAYIIAFSVIIQLLFKLPLPDSGIKIFLLSCLEITTGIKLLCTSFLPAKTVFILCLFLTSFGGLCAACQTQSMLKGTGISFLSYLTKKLVTAMVTSLLTIVYLTLFMQ